ncbi:hypothetical protein [Clostridium sp.]|uniref:hypothetical protein n=1 Tax=Clostridium sp. TaxID=1506 RepID=UPI0026325684|nr:hypothetical protein [uncultured Clostridium sp.]
MIVNKSGQYETEDGWLSLIGVRKTNRFKDIEVEYFDSGFKMPRENTQDELLKLFNMKQTIVMG